MSCTTWSLSGAAVVLMLAASSCSRCGGNNLRNSNTPKIATTEELISRGKAVYIANCTACHNPNPKKPGNVGPEVYGSSLELLLAKLVSGTYPEGYAPRRSTKMMTPLPHLKSEIEALYNYLNH